MKERLLDLGLLLFVFGLFVLIFFMQLFFMEAGL